MKAINKVKKVWKEHGNIVVAIGAGIIVSGLSAYGMKWSYKEGFNNGMKRGYKEGFNNAVTVNYLCALTDKEKYVKMVQQQVNKLPENASTWFESNAEFAISYMDKVLKN